MSRKLQKAQNKVQVTFTREVTVRGAVQLNPKVIATKAITAALKECG